MTHNSTALTDLAGTGAAPGAPYLDFGARLYSPGTATWLSVDPLAEKYYGIGPLTYCAGNPVNLVDPTGMIFTERSGNYLEYLISYTKGQIKEQMSQITTLCKSLNDSNISDQIKGQIETMIDNARQLITDYSEALYEINVLKESSQVYDIYESSMYNTETHYGSGVSYNHSNGNFDIVIGIKNYFSLAHELKHAFQFDSGDFSSGHSAKGIPFYDLYDELDAYQRGALYGGDTRSLGSLASDPLYYKLQQNREGASLHPLYPASRWQQISNKYQSVFRINGVLYVPNN